MLDSLNQVQKEGVIPKRGSKWGPVLAQKPTTRGHGNINIMEKAAAYKRKKNLEIPETFKGKSFSTVDKSILADQLGQLNLVIGGDES